jgi:hypothetical protein
MSSFLLQVLSKKNLRSDEIVGLSPRVGHGGSSCTHRMSMHVGIVLKLWYVGIELRLTQNATLSLAQIR